MATDLLKVSIHGLTSVTMIVPQQEVNQFLKTHTHLNNPIVVTIVEKT